MNCCSTDTITINFAEISIFFRDEIFRWDAYTCIWLIHFVGKYTELIKLGRAALC